MQRIGIAASKIAKGNLLLYNLFVVILSLLFSLFVFCLSGLVVVLGLVLIGYWISESWPKDVSSEWWQVVRLCMVTLTALTGLLTLIAIIKNIRLRF